MGGKKRASAWCGWEGRERPKTDRRGWRAWIREVACGGSRCQECRSRENPLCKSKTSTQRTQRTQRFERERTLRWRSFPHRSSSSALQQSINEEVAGKQGLKRKNCSRRIAITKD